MKSFHVTLLYLGLRTHWTQKGSRRSFDPSWEGGGTAVCRGIFRLAISMGNQFQQITWQRLAQS